MTILQLKDRVAYLLFFAKMIVITWVVFLWLSGDYESNDVMIILSIIIPLLSLHLTMIIRDMLENKEKGNYSDTEIRQSLVVFSHMLPILYALVLILLISTVPALGKDFNTMISSLGIAEAVIGIYLGMIVSELYKPQKIQKKKKR